MDAAAVARDDEIDRKYQFGTYDGASVDEASAHRRPDSLVVQDLKPLGAGQQQQQQQQQQRALFDSTTDSTSPFRSVHPPPAASSSPRSPSSVASASPGGSSVISSFDAPTHFPFPPAPLPPPLDPPRVALTSNQEIPHAQPKAAFPVAADHNNSPPQGIRSFPLSDAHHHHHHHQPHHDSGAR